MVFDTARTMGISFHRRETRGANGWRLELRAA